MIASVVVPTYGRPAHVRACVAALQAQDAEGLEIVVVDDGSPEAVAGLPEGPHPCRTIRQENAGPAAARNRGARAASGGLLLLTDDDCRPDPGWVRAMLAAAAPGTMLGGRTVNAAPGPYAAASQTMAEHLSGLQDGQAPFFPSNNVAMPRDEYLALGGFPEDYPLAAGEDRALCRAWAASGRRFAAVPDAVVRHHHALTLRSFWRQHSNYGRGAHRYHGERAPGAADGPRLGTAIGLVASPFAARPRRGAVLGAGLIALAQVATAAGYARAARAARNTPSGDAQ